VFTRAANVYGPGQQVYRIIPRTMLFAMTGRKLQLHGGGHSIRSFIHIDDVADATRRIAIDGKPGSAYHVSTTSTVSIRELVDQICQMTGVPFDELVEVTPDRLGKDEAYLLDTRRLRDDLGWSDRIDLRQGMTETLSWLEENLSLLERLPYDYQHRQ
jgi:dTDP-glucose 4,6-dehydratase